MLRFWWRRETPARPGGVVEAAAEVARWAETLEARRWGRFLSFLTTLHMPTRLKTCSQ
jgi:hypothetical protein